MAGRTLWHDYVNRAVFNCPQSQFERSNKIWKTTSWAKPINQREWFSRQAMPWLLPFADRQKAVALCLLLESLGGFKLRSLPSRKALLEPLLHFARYQPVSKRCLNLVSFVQLYTSVLLFAACHSQRGRQAVSASHLWAGHREIASPSSKITSWGLRKN